MKREARANARVSCYKEEVMRLFSHIKHAGTGVDKTVLYNLSYGLYAIGVNDPAQERATGCIVNTVVQVASQPARISLAINYDNYTCALINRTGRFSVSILSESTDPAVITNLGFRSGRDCDKFTGFAAAATESGLPIVAEGCCGYLECEVRGTLDAGTHCLILADVVSAFAPMGKTAPPMTYAYYHDVIKGQAPKNAPTYQGDEEALPSNQPKHGAETQQRWQCGVCGYIYEGVLASEPDDYVCPICGAKKERFVKV